MRVFKTTCITVVLLLFLPPIAFADNLCGVATTQLTSDQLDIGFETKRHFRLETLNNGDRKEYHVSNAGLTANGEKFAGIRLVLGAVAYAHYNEHFSCLLRFEEREGVKGLAIEEYRYSPKEPPQINTQFVEAF